MFHPEQWESRTTKPLISSIPSVLRTTQFVTQSASIVAILVGCLVLIGWSLDLTFLKTIVPESSTMKANTALGFILAGISLILAGSEKQEIEDRQGERHRKFLPRLLRFLSQSCAIAVFLIGSLTLSQYLFGWNLGIDELLFSDSHFSSATLHPGRMGLNTALNFVLVGGALWLLSAGKHKMAILVSQGLSLVGGFISVLAFVGYVYGVRVFYQFSIYTTSMALPTSLTFGMLCLGIFLARGDRGLMRPISSDLMGGIIARRLIPCSIFISLFFGRLILEGERAGYYDPIFSMTLLVVSLNLIFVWLIWRDVNYLNKIDSDRRRSDKRLRTSERIARQQLAEIESIYQTAPIGLNVLDTNLRFVRINERLAQINGFSVEEHIGRTVRELLPNLADKAEPVLRRVLAGEVLLNVEIVGETPAQPGVQRTWLEHFLPLKDGDRVIGIGTVCEEITERKQAERQLKQQAEELRQLNFSLTQTTSELAERNQEMERFVYVVSHDLKAPLRAIANLSEWISEDLSGQLPEENQHQLELLRARVYRMEAIIDGLLAYSRVGRTEIPTETVDVGELLGEILDSLSPPPTFTIFVQPQMPTIVTKKLFLSQVFTNLISNAIKHHDRTDGRIEIVAIQKGKYYEFSVIDDGPGIQPEYHEKIFDIFQTLNENRKESTGIGLSIVQKIVETEGGEIILESELGKGAKFRFTWPGVK